MKHITKWLLIAGVLVFTNCNHNKNAAETTKPNVILIVTDDQGFGDIGYYGNHNIKTPVLDNLASKSVRFDEFLVSPVCAPTRAAIMTGKHAMSAGVHDTHRGGALMATSEVTIAEILKQGNYKTGMIGKWHLGDNYPMRPQDQGFDYTLNHLSGGIGQYGDWPNTLKGVKKSYFDPILWENGKQVQTQGYCTDVLTDAAIDFVDKNKENPFFLYLAYNAPHGPLQVPEKYYNMYKDIDPDAGFDDNIPFPKVTPHSKESARKVYGMVTNIDDNLGILFQKLEDLKLDKKTLVVFMTDNGPEQARYVGGMRGKKGSVFQGGVRVPSFWYYPKGFKEARDIKTPAHHYDILPTLAEFCGVTLPEDLEIKGRSLLPLLTDKLKELPEQLIHRYWHRTSPVKYKNVSTRKGNLKLVGMGKTASNEDQFELFDITKDPYEQNNIAEEHPKVTETLKVEMDRWLDSMMSEKHIVNAPRPIIGTEFENPVMLNQNDALFVRVKEQKKELMYWDLINDKAQPYNIIVHFDRPLKTNGILKLIIGNQTKEIAFNGTGQTSITINNIKIPKGEFTLMPKVYLNKNNKMKFTYPFYVEMQNE